MKFLKTKTDKRISSTIPVKCFVRFLRALREYPFHLWDDETIKNYEGDKEYLKKIYKENSLRLNFSEAYELAQIELFKNLLTQNIEQQKINKL